MKAARRLCAVVLQSALLVMSLAGSGFACEGAGTEAMPMDMGGMASHHTQSPGGSDETPADSPSDCSFPWAPAGCQSMTSCSLSAIEIDSDVWAVAATSGHEEIAWRGDHLRSVARSPEPPPPRA